MKRFRRTVIANALARRNGVPPPLYVFTSATFTPAGATGRNGPTLAQCRTAYSSTGYTWAATYLDMTTQGYQLWTVPKTGSYTVTCAGAASPKIYGEVGKTGAIVQVTLDLIKGDILQLLVGQQGVSPGAAVPDGGSGGSFIASGVTPASGVCLVAAGGGGGGEAYLTTANNQNPGVSTTSGGQGLALLGGTNGSGGGRAQGSSTGGGGFIGNGADSLTAGVAGGLSFQNGGTGGDSLGFGAYGGFGGGGGARTFGSGGGGGGYSGGQGGGLGGSAGQFRSGGGGSFYPGGTYVSGLNTGDGYITITAV